MVDPFLGRLCKTLAIVSPGSPNVTDNQSMIPMTSQRSLIENDCRKFTNEDTDGVASGDQPVENVGSSTSRGTRKTKKYRHSTHQTQELESFFKACPHPDDEQWKLLSRDLELKRSQVQLWFQNKHNRMKMQDVRLENSQFRLENETLRAENMRLRDTLSNCPCHACGGPIAVNDLSLGMLHLRLENDRLKIEIDRMTYAVTRCIGKPVS